MYKTEQFFQSAALLITLTFLSVLSAHSYIIILIAGILLLIFTERSLCEKQNHLLCILQLLLSVAFTTLSANIYSYLIFYECRFFVRRARQILYAPLTCLLFQMTFTDKALPDILSGSVFLAVFSSMIYWAELLIRNYLNVKNQIAHAISATAVNEMYERKLNRELIIKNYLADRNARLEERENISRSIHNSVGHSITAAIITLDAADLLFDSAPDKAREKMNIANTRIRASLEAVRRAVRVLDEDTRPVDFTEFISGLKHITDSFMTDTRLRIRTDFPVEQSSVELPGSHTEFLTGALQELLTNGIRHGNADLFIVSLIMDSRHIKLRVKDNGKSSFSEKNASVRIGNGFGLKKLSSYAKRCGGSASFTNRGGFEAIITLPL